MFIDLQFLDLLKQLKLTLLCPSITVHSVSTILSIFLCTLHISSFHILFLNTRYLHCCCINTYCTIVSTMLTPYSPPITTLQSSQAVGTTPPPPGIPSCYSAVSSVWFLSSVSASLAFCSLFSASELYSVVSSPLWESSFYRGSECIFCPAVVLSRRPLCCPVSAISSIYSHELYSTHNKFKTL